MVIYQNACVWTMRRNGVKYLDVVKGGRVQKP